MLKKIYIYKKKIVTSAVDGSKVANHSSNAVDPDFGAANDRATPIKCKKIDKLVYQNQLASNIL